MSDASLRAIDDFYDPERYEKEIGPGNRVGEAYLAAANESGGPVLELGCGTGDVLIPIARAGFTVCGIDASSRMLDICRQRVTREPADVQARVSVVAMRMESTDAAQLPPEFQQIFIPNDGILHLLTLADLEATLANCFRLLRPGGRLMFDVPVFDVEYLGRCAGASSESLRFRGRYSHEDYDLQVWERTHYDGSSGILEADFRYEYLDFSGTLERTVCRTLRQCPRRVDELKSALGHSGFDSIAVGRLADRVRSAEGHIFSAVRPSIR